jgi:hypothetical protein
MDFSAYIEVYYGITADISVNTNLDTIYIPKVPRNDLFQTSFLDFWTLTIVFRLKNLFEN